MISATRSGNPIKTSVTARINSNSQPPNIAATMGSKVIFILLVTKANPMKGYIRPQIIPWISLAGSSTYKLGNACNPK